MNQETARPFDILIADGETNRLTNVGTAWPTPKGAGYRFTTKAAIQEGTQLVMLPSRSRGKSTPAASGAEE